MTALQAGLWAKRTFGRDARTDNSQLVGNPGLSLYEARDWM